MTAETLAEQIRQLIIRDVAKQAQVLVEAQLPEMVDAAIRGITVAVADDLMRRGYFIQVLNGRDEHKP